MRIKHKLNPGWRPKEEPMSARYAMEVERSTNRSAQAYAKALRDLEKAQAKAARARAIKVNTPAAIRAIRVADELVELRRAELKQLEAMMLAVPASAQHRGVRSFRPLPPPDGGI